MGKLTNGRERENKYTKGLNFWGAFFYIAAGVTIGAIRFMSKRKLLRTWNKTEILKLKIGIVSTSANWAVGTFCGVSAVSFEMCQMERKQKLEKLRMIVKATDSQRNEKLVITERGKNGAFDVVIETPSKKE